MAAVRHSVHDRVFNENAGIILLTIFVLALAVRLLGISDRVLWYDELYSVTFAAQPLGDLLSSVRNHDPHPPLYYLQLHFWMKFGTEETWLRLNSVIWSVSALAPTYFAGRRILGENGARWAVLFLAISPTVVYYSHEVRMYAMQMCLVGVNLLVLERLLAREQRWADLPIFFLTLVAVIYVHGSGFLLLLPVSVYCLLRLRTELRSALALKLFLTLLAAAICALPWLLEAEGTNLSHLRADGLEAIPRVLVQLLIDRSIEVNALPALMGFFCLSAAAVVVLLRMPKTRNLTIAYVVVAFSATLVLAYLVAPLWHVKSLVGMMPVLSILAGGLLAAAFERLGQNARATAILAVGVVVALGPRAVSINGEDDYRRMHYETAQYLLRETNPGDIIEIEDARDFWTLAWYLSGPGSVTVDNEKSTLLLPDGRQARKMDPTLARGSADWAVERNNDWRDDPAVRAPGVDTLETFARFVVYRNPVR